MTSDRRVCKQPCDTLLWQRMEEQADHKDLLKQYLQDFVQFSQNNSSFCAVAGKTFFYVVLFPWMAGQIFPLVCLLITEPVSSFL